MSDISSYFEKQLEKFGKERAQHIFFTSDSHFGHANIIKFCNRPFTTVEEMDETLIKNWNERVQPDDIVFHLGDFAWGGSGVWNTILDRLNGHIHLILGNHDMKNLRQGYIAKFASVSFQKQIYIEDRCVYLNHYPFLCYGGAYRHGKDAVWELFGHVHSSPIKYDLDHIDDPEVKEILGKDDNRLHHLFPTQFDVGVDNNDFRPVSWAEVKEAIERQVKEYKSYRDLDQDTIESYMIEWYRKVNGILNDPDLDMLQTKHQLDILNFKYAGYFNEAEYRDEQKRNKDEQH